MTPEDELALCQTCAIQFDAPLSSPPSNCPVCDDPRQYVPPGGQQWTSLGEQKKICKNIITELEPNIWTITSDPKFGIGQRAFFLKTPHGNVLWDCIGLLGDETVAFIESHGGLTALAISHPHYYTTHLTWARAFNCRVVLSAEDAGWHCRTDSDQRRDFMLPDERTREIVPGVTVIKTGGHFPGITVLHWEGKLFIADAIQTVASGLSPRPVLPGTVSFSFMWSYPNMIPLAPDEIKGIWDAVEPFEFTATHGAFPGQDIRAPDVKGRLKESMRVIVQKSGWEEKVKAWGW